ncbi:heparinase [Actinocatenispora thailandica]|uniref:Heparinase n=1 Tax=Actinocatenispora thailandica TaxID=227318 RepID=A0A7R7DM83_9ACTN|nr:heparinase II/III family protein [Actinocatenispora thailandica]BCJ34329.1 heparinase [Actinocatenispora thailandica]
MPDPAGGGAPRVPARPITGMLPTDAELVRLLADPGRRIGVADVTDRARWDRVEPRTRATVLAAATEELAGPAPQPLAGSWARTFRDGARGEYETTVWRLRDRITRLTLAAVLTGEVAPAAAPAGDCPHLDAAIDGLVLLAEATTWCWAPHDRYTAARGELLADPDQPYLDLGAAEVVSLFAWADHALGRYLDVRLPGLRRRLRREADRRVLGPFERTRDWPWIGAGGRPNNWNPWIHGAVLAASLLLCDDPARRARLVRLAAAGLDHYLAALPPDGGLDEGIAYWWQGPCRLLEALDLLAAVDAVPGIQRVPVLAAVLRYPQRVHLGADWYVNVGDAPARLPGEQPWQVPYRWGRRLAQPATVAHALAGARATGRAVHPAGGLGRALAALADPDWCAAATATAPPGMLVPDAVSLDAACRDVVRPDVPPAGGERLDNTEASGRGPIVSGPGGAAAQPWLPDRCWFPGTQLLVAREAAGTSAGLAVAVKAGHNGEHHNHLDVGSYWVALDGTPLVVDAGRPTYTAATFGPDRYAGWPMRSDWHNVPEPGAGQRPGDRYRARDVEVVLDAGMAALRAELAGAYPPGAVTSLRREVRLTGRAAGEPARVLVTDEWAGAAGPVLLRQLLAGEVRLGDGFALVAGVLRIEWDARRATGSLSRQEIDDPVLRRSWGPALTRLTLTATDEHGAGTVRDGRVVVAFRAAGVC